MGIDDGLVPLGRMNLPELVVGNAGNTLDDDFLLFDKLT